MSANDDALLPSEIPGWIRELLLELDKLPPKLRDSFLIPHDGRPLICKLEPPCLFDLKTGEYRFSASSTLGRKVTQDQYRCSCYGCLASQGSSFAARQLGFLNELNIGSKPSNLQQAAEWYGIAAVNDYDPAWTDLARVFRFMIKDRNNYDVMLQQIEPIFRKSSRTSNSEEQVQFARFLVSTGVEDKVVEGRRLLQKLCVAGSAEALFLLGLEERGTSEGVEMIRTAARQHYVPAMVHLARMLESGLGIKHDSSQALFWYEKAAEERDPVAMFRLAQLTQDTDRRRSLSLLEAIMDTVSDHNLRAQAQFALACSVMETDEDYAIELLKEAARSGLGAAHCKLGLHLIQKDSTCQEAIMHLKAAVEYPDYDPEAALELGRYYLESDCSEGLMLISKASDSGYPPALVLGYRLLRDSDIFKALSWLQQAASMGYADAQTELGIAYEEGVVNGTPDFLSALNFYKKASAQSDPRAQFRLYSLLAREQEYDTKEFSSAVRWLKLSADHDYSPAQAKLGMLLAELTPDQATAIGLHNANCLYYLDSAAMKGDAFSACEASKIRLERDTEFEKAIHDLDLSAQKGCVSSQMLLVEIFMASIFPSKEKLPSYLNLAASSNHYAQYLLCASMCNLMEVVKMHLIHSEDPSQEQLNRGLFEAKTAAIQGNIQCQYLLGLTYQRGIIVDADFNEAQRWFKLSACEGNPDAALSMSKLCSSPDVAYWIRAAITLGSTGALFPERLNSMKKEDVLQLMHTAAESGNQFAMVHYAAQCGNNVEQRKWMEKAALLGVPKAQRWLAKSFQDENDAAAWAQWLERAAEGGDAEAQEEISAWEMHPRHELFSKRLDRRKSGSPFSIEECIVDLALPIDELTAMAELGDHRAQYCLSLRLFADSCETPLSKSAFRIAKRWLRKSARSGNACAQVAMAFLLMTDSQMSRACLPRAFSLLIEASECGYNEAFYILGLKFSRDVESCLQYLERAAMLGHQLALCHYAGQMFGLGRALSEEIVQLLEQAAEYNNVEAAYWLCRLGTQTKEKCVKLLQYAASKNHVRSQILLGDMLSSRALGNTFNPSFAEFCYYRAAAQLSDIAQYRLAAILYARGDVDKSNKLFEQSCAQGNFAALEWLSMRPFGSVSMQTRNAVQILISSDAPAFAFFLASLFETEPTVQMTYLEKSAVKGHIQAQYHLSRAYLRIGDMQNAIAWLKKAADQGDVSACDDLALCLLTGYGSSPDWLSARSYLLKAAQLGSSKAACLLSTLFSMISFKYPSVSTWSTGNALVWGLAARRLSPECTSVISGISTPVQEYVGLYLNEMNKDLRFTALKILRSKISMEPQARKRVANIVIAMCGSFQSSCNFENDIFAKMQRHSLIRRGAIAYPDQKRLLPAAVQFLYGDCVVPDICLASRFLLSAAGRGNPSAQILVGFFYELGGLGVCFQPWQCWASFWYSQAALSGNSSACISYAEMFERKSCWTSAALFYQRASELGSSLARSRLLTLYEANADLENAVDKVMLAAQRQRSWTLISGCYSDQSPLRLLRSSADVQLEGGASSFSIIRKILEFSGVSHLAWYPEPEVDFSEFIRSQIVDRDSDHLSQGNRILLEDPEDVNSAVVQFNAAARKGNAECMVLLGNAIDCGWIPTTELSTLWYKKGNAIGFGLATQWIASSLLTSSSQNAASAFATLKRAQHQIVPSSKPFSTSFQLYLRALSNGLENAFPSLQESFDSDTLKKERCLALLLNLCPDAGQHSPIFIAIQSMSPTLEAYNLDRKVNFSYRSNKGRNANSEAFSEYSFREEMGSFCSGNDSSSARLRFLPFFRQLFSTIFEMSGDISH